ncbi:MAG: Gfo/Idh/MocA family oxidoreductase [Kiritimatiellia bacterium]|nr:Gfo/Idh/MocA family oxidoreductase [Kiritimatiellia bacterium]
MTAARSLEQVVTDCDGIVVLAPSNPEVHERLSDLALRSGKPVYVDKPFAPDAATARRLIAKAGEYQTPLMSCSALRFGPALQKAVRGAPDGKKAEIAALVDTGVRAPSRRDEWVPVIR